MRIECAFAHNVGEINIPPVLKRENIEVEIQCELGSSKLAGDDSESEKSEPEQMREEPAPSLAQQIKASFKEQAAHEEKAPEEAIEKEKEQLSKEDIKSITSTDEFTNFFEKTSRLVLRGLNTEADVLGSFGRLEEDRKVVQRGEQLVETIEFLKEKPV